MKRKVWDITVKDNPNRVVMGENDEFYTTDTEAYLIFQLDDKNFNPATAVLTLENRNDGSLKNETVDVVDGLVEWEMPQRYIEHFGNWQGQLVYEDTKDGQPELYTSAPFSFVVNAHIGDKKKPSLVEIENWEKFIREGTELIETWEDMEDLRQANEAQRQANYQELLDTGVLQTNINNKLAEAEQEYAPRLTELEQNDENLTAQLAQKVGGGKLANLDDLDGGVIAAIEGGEGTFFELLSVPKDGSVTPEKVTFIKEYPNLINKNKITYGFSSAQDGIVYSDWYDITDYIQVKEGETFTFSPGTRYVSFHNEDKQYVSVITAVDHHNVPFTFTANEDGYVIGTIYKDKTEEIVLNRGESANVSNDKYGYYLDNEVIDLPISESLDDFMATENEKWEVQ